MNACLGRFCDTRPAIGWVGRDALLRVAKQGPLKQICSLKIDGKRVPSRTEPWIASAGDEIAGQIVAAAWSPDFGTDVAIGMIGRDFRDEGTASSPRRPTAPGRRGHGRALAVTD